MRTFVVLGFVFPYQAKRLVWESIIVSKMTCFVSSGTLHYIINYLKWPK